MTFTNDCFKTYIVESNQRKCAHHGNHEFILRWPYCAHGRSCSAIEPIKDIDDDDDDVVVVIGLCGTTVTAFIAIVGVHSLIV